MREMIKRVARALQRDIDANCAVRLTNAMCLELARVAVAAMREPTQEMLEAGDARFTKCWSLEPGEGLDEQPPLPLWQAMIDAALADETMTEPTATSRASPS